MMKKRYLLDTHTFLWMAADPASLSHAVSEIVRKNDSSLYLSAASGWEIAVLTKLNRLSLPDEPQRFVPEAMQKLTVIPLPIGFQTAITASLLPLIHRDPFDRIIIAEAMKEKMIILTKDKTFAEYGVRSVW